LDRYLIVEDLVVAPALDHHIAHGGERHRRLSDDFDSVSYLPPLLSGNAPQPSDWGPSCLLSR
jgi:hypothetical protein